MPKNKPMYLRMRLNRWSDITASLGQISIPIQINKSIGYLEVYESLEDMQKDYPKEKDFVEIEETKK